MAALTGCQSFSGRPPSDAYPASLEIVEAQASLHRFADEEGEPLGDDLYVLQTSCVLKVRNTSGRDQEVVTEYGTAYDDIRLRIRSSDGLKLVTTSHTLMMDPLVEQQWTVLQKGATIVELVSATPVGPPGFKEDFPYIVDKTLTPTIQLEYFGGFPGSDLSRATQSNRIDVKIDDRTADVPRRSLPLPVPQDHV